MSDPRTELRDIDSELFVLEDGLRILRLAAEADGEVSREEREQLEDIEAEIGRVRMRRDRLEAEIAAAEEGGLAGIVAALRRLYEDGGAEGAARSVAAAACSEGTKPLSAREALWVREVRADPDIAMLFDLYGQHATLAEPRIGRVETFCEEDGSEEKTTEGVHYNDAADSPGPDPHDILLSDKAYSIREAWTDLDGNPVVTTEEEEFKATLIHEMIHFLQHATEEVADPKVPTPNALMRHMVGKTAEFGYYAWTPPEGGLLIAHLDDAEISTLHGGSTALHLVPDSPLGRLKQAGGWESPVDGRGLEEDVATMLSMFLTSERSRTALMVRAPKRYDLCAEFVDVVTAAG